MEWLFQGARLLYVLAGICVALGFLNIWLKHVIARRRAMADTSVHTLGSGWPQTGTSFFGGMVRRTYAVPKDPQAYAKIFVPPNDTEGRPK
jgi:hypothetical protein